MPIYEYRCDACGEVFEIIAGLSERDQKSVCPACGDRRTTRLYGSVQLGGKRTSMNPENFVRPHGPLTPQGPAGGRKGAGG